MTDPITFSRPIFIVGPGRSGTTLLRSLLSAHSRIAVTPETQFMARAEAWGLKNGSPNDFDAFWENYTSWLRFRDLGVSADRCRELIEQQGEHSFAAVFKAVLAAYGEKEGKPRIGEKSPSHVRFLPTLLDWFPDAQVLVTQRDPRAVIASQVNTYYVQKKLKPRSLRHSFFSDKREQEILHYAKEWVADFEERLKPWKDDPRFHTVVYEDFVQNPEQEVRTIFDFLGERFEPSVLTERNDDTVPPPAAQNQDRQWEQWRSEHHAKTLQDISADSLNKWKSQLTKTEVALIEGCCAESMNRFGYAPSLTPRLLRAGRAAASVLGSADIGEKKLREIGSRGRRRAGGARRRIRTAFGRAVANAVARGMRPAWFGYNQILHETVHQYFRRNKNSSGTYEIVHSEDVAKNPLPRNMTSREELPDDRGWWGYSFWDVPERTSSETFIATLPNCLITWYRDPENGNDFYPAIVNGDSRALDMRELRFRPPHVEAIRRSTQPLRLKRATWVTERVYHNHSHWLTAHLPKLLLLKQKGLLGEVILPPERTASMDGSLRMLGLEPNDFRSYDPDRPLFVEELTVVGTDRFRPELLQLVPKAFAISDADVPHRKVFISRLGASRRRLVNEDEVWLLLEPQGFERVRMEDMTFEEQVALMRETSILVAPHGAGLTNMIFCPKGAQIVEIADLSFPNPNFYALASALGHDYWLAPAESLGELHPLEKDLRVDPTVVNGVLTRLAPSSAELAVE